MLCGWLVGWLVGWFPLAGFSSVLNACGGQWPRCLQLLRPQGGRFEVNSVPWVRCRVSFLGRVYIGVNELDRAYHVNRTPSLKFLPCHRLGGHITFMDMFSLIKSFKPFSRER